MTLIAAFRCPKGGVLFCADRQEDDGYTKREVGKITRIPVGRLNSCDIWIAGTGNGELIKKFCTQLDASLFLSAQSGSNIFDEHEALIQAELSAFYRQWRTDIKRSNGMIFIIVIAPFKGDHLPILYRTQETALIPHRDYCAAGSGQPIADYLADRIGTHGYSRMEYRATGIAAAFIMREAQWSSAGVGLGADMIFIQEGTRGFYFIPSSRVKELEECIPSLGECILGHWPGNIVVPTWYQDL